jgi:fibronectin-binding autotransporter adhesin
MRQMKYQLRKSVQPTIAPLSAAIGLALGASQLQAAVITVNDLSDATGGSTCTLRNAIYSASLETAQGGCIAGSAGGNQIVFAPGLTGTIQLNAAAANVYDDATLRIGSELTITGPGADQLTIRGDNNSSVIYAKYSAAAVTIQGVTITNGNADLGGGIFSRTPNLTLMASRITGNTAELAGGGVWHDGATSYSSFYIGSSLVDGNLAFGMDNADGGGGVGIDFGGTGGDALILNTRFESNIAWGPGGGLLVRSDDYSYAVVSASQFLDNTSKYGGGGAYFDLGYATADLTSNVFEGNSATDDFGFGVGGGAVILESNTTYSQAAITLNGNYFSYNQAEGSGGGLALNIVGTTSADTKWVSAYANYFVQNSAGVNGGGALIMAGQEVDIDLSALLNLANEASNAGGGLLMAAQQSEISLDTVLNIDNRSAVGGGMYAAVGNATVYADDLGNKYNQADYAGGGAFVSLSDDSALIMQRPVFYYNESGYGGGLLAVGTGASVFMSDAIVRQNSAVYGGGLMASSAGMDLTIKYSEISANQGFLGGGAFVSSSNSSSVIANSTVSGNSSGDGGGLWFSGTGAEVDLKYATVAYNQASAEGGGIFANLADVNISNSILSGNTAGGSGAAVEGSSNFYVAYSLIDDPTTNASKYDEGGNIFKYSADLAPLDYNGGFNLNHAIDSNSRAFNAGSSTVSAIADQRGEPRVAFDRVDMGAFEAQSLADLIFRDRFQTP